MEDLPSGVKAFLQNQPFLELTESDAKKIKCTLNGHEFPCNLAELQNFVAGKKYKKLSAGAEFNYKQYEPHVVPQPKQPDHLFCNLTLRHLNRIPHHVLRHVNGKRYQRALENYEECKRQGVQFVPACLIRKKPKCNDAVESDSEKGRQTKKDNEMWEPSFSEGEGQGGDSEDSMADLYPSTLFTLKKGEGEEEMEKGKEEEEMEKGKEEGDDFQTDEEEMEVSVTEAAKQAPLKRRKVQSGGFQKKFKNHNRRWKGFKNSGQVKNGK